MTNLAMLICIMVAIAMASLGITAAVAYHIYATKPSKAYVERKIMIDWLEEREV